MRLSRASGEPGRTRCLSTSRRFARACMSSFFAASYFSLSSGEGFSLAMAAVMGQELR